MNTTLSRALLVTGLALGLTAPLSAQETPTAGAVYTMTNDPVANEILIFDRALDGSLGGTTRVATGGRGTGGSLGNQCGIILSTGNRYLFAVNAGSDDISVFRVKEDTLELIAIQPALGVTPVSLAYAHHLLYVVNAGSDSITGFYVMPDGSLQFIPGSIRLLSGVGTAPAQISFSPNDDFLITTEKATDVIGVFPMEPTGIAGQGSFTPSMNATPFGFAFGSRDQLIVSEAAGGAPNASTLSSYELQRDGSLSPISSAVPTTQSAACWVVVNPSAQIAFTANTGSDSISAFRVRFDGELQLIRAASANVGGGPLDMALTQDGRFFYVLNSAVGTIGDYRVRGADLIGIPGGITGLPAGTNGLAVR